MNASGKPGGREEKMTEKISINAFEKDEPVKGTPGAASLAYRAGLFVVFLICALAVFVFGSNYYQAFPTNGSTIYAAGLTIFFLIAAVLLRRSTKFSKFWQIAYAFCVASVVNLVSTLFAGYNTAILGFFNLTVNTTQGLAVAKLYDALLVVIPILAMIKFSRADLGSLFLARGNLKWGLGIGSLVLFNFLTSALIFFANSYNDLAVLGTVIGWGAVFAFSNGFLEELWMRGLFMKKLVPLMGVAGTILLTSIWFASLHMLAVAYLPATVIPVFLVNTFTLGLACGYLMVKTNSIWGAVLIHAAADWFLFIATLAVR
jgi:membrane protease YdiL (CAAX protease family)